MRRVLAVVATGPPGDLGVVLAAVERTRRRHRVFLQVTNVDIVYDALHIKSALLHAERALRRGLASGRSLETEYLRYLTGQRQVRRALERAGARPGARRHVVVAAGTQAARAVRGLLAELGWRRVSGRIGPNRRALDHLDVPRSARAITPRARWGDLALERVALLDLETPVSADPGVEGRRRTRRPTATKASF